MSQEAVEDEKHEAMRSFALKYGLLGIMAAIPTTPRFLSYENVFFPKNRFIREESMTVEKYLNEFFPFKKMNIRKKGSEYSWDIEGGKEVVLLGMLRDGRPDETHINEQFTKHMRIMSSCHYW